jgi:hypothetical protein
VEYMLAICVVQTKKAYMNQRVERWLDEAPEVFAERVKQHIIAMITKPNTT